MRQFMLILEENPSSFAQVTPDEMQRIVERYMAWSDDLARRDRLAGGQKLRDEGGRVLRRSGAGAAVTDGAYAEAKEVIGGYFLIRAADYDEAVELASSCPHLDYGTIHVRQIDETITPSDS
jgi:hypothetical protein